MSTSRRRASPAEPLVRRSPTAFLVESDHRSILEAIAELKSDKESLKAALKSAILKRDELTDRVLSLEDAAQVLTARRKELESENQQLRRENEVLARTAEECRREQSRLFLAKDDDQRVIRDLVERTKALEAEVRRVAHRREKSRLSRETSQLVKSATGGSALDDDLQKYTQFVLEKLEDLPDLMSLFRGRVGSLRRFWQSLKDREYPDCFLKSLQFLSDLLVYYNHGKTQREVRPISRPEARIELPVKTTAEENSTARSVSCQTLTDQATNTSPRMDVKEADFTPTFAPKKIETMHRGNDLIGLHRPRTYDLGAFMSTTASTNNEGFLSPTSYKSQYSARGEDEYAKLMDESESLLSTLHLQSDRLIRLNTQIQHTMQESSRQQGPSLRYEALSRPESSVQKPPATVPTSPEQATSPHKEEGTTEVNSPVAIPDIDLQLAASSSEFLVPPKAPKKPASKSKTVRKTPLYKAYPNKTDVGRI